MKWREITEVHTNNDNKHNQMKLSTATLTNMRLTYSFQRTNQLSSILSHKQSHHRAISPFPISSTFLLFRRPTVIWLRAQPRFTIELDGRVQWHTFIKKTLAPHLPQWNTNISLKANRSKANREHFLWQQLTQPSQFEMFNDDWFSQLRHSTSSNSSGKPNQTMIDNSLNNKTQTVWSSFSSNTYEFDELFFWTTIESLLSIKSLHSAGKLTRREALQINFVHWSCFDKWIKRAPMCLSTNRNTR